MDLRSGAAVRHPAYGEGVVLAVRDRERVRVRFEGWQLLPLTIRRADLELISGGNGRRQAPPSPALPAVPPALPAVSPALPAVPPADPSEIPDLRQAIEALRLGVVPRGCARDYTVARERELHEFERLAAEGRGLRLVWGDYGTGKTHLLDIYEQMALAHGYLTSRVTLDPRETPPQNPQRLFTEIVRSLRYPDEPAAGLDPLFLKLEDSEDHRRGRGARASRVLSPVLYAAGYPESAAATWVEDYIAGYPMDVDDGERELRKIGWNGPRPLALSDYRTYGRMYVNLVGTVASWAGDAGYRGLAVLFDEVEYIDMVRGDSKHLAREVLQHYAAVTVEPERLAFDPGELYKGGQEIHRRIPLRFADDQSLLVVMALTPLPEAEEVARRILAGKEDDLELTRLTSRDFSELARRVARLYDRAHPAFTPGAGLVERLAEEAREDAILSNVNPREIVRRTVLSLDAARLGRP